MYFRVHITPRWTENTVSSLAVTGRTDRGAGAGEDVSAHITEVVTIPFCPIFGLAFTDGAGPLPVEERECEEGFIRRKYFAAKRDTVGEVTWSYRITPRVQPQDYRSSPYFDLVAEKGGVLGAGNTFLLHPPEREGEYDFSLAWDLSGLPEGCRAVWSFGEGNTERHCTLEEILFTAYMVGQVRSVERETAGFYWFDTLPFDAEEGTEQVVSLFAHMAALFRDKGGYYRVFTRHNGFPGGGGTAFPRSYIYGYGKDDKVTVAGLQSLLAHEMVHNWPAMADEPAGAGTWYVEGSAEYYSVMVPLEAGLCSAERAAEYINEKAGNYYANPQNHLSNMELGKRYWTDRRCQRVPYGRGMIYLANLDARIRRATGGERRLIDLELALLALEKPTAEDFLRLGEEIAGFDLRPGYEAMCRGDFLEPEPEAFGGRFTAEPCMVRINNAQHTVQKELLEKEAPGFVWRVSSNPM